MKNLKTSSQSKQNFVFAISIWLFLMPLIVYYHQTFVSEKLQSVIMSQSIVDFFSFGKFLWLLLGVLASVTYLLINYIKGDISIKFQRLDMLLFFMLASIVFSFFASQHRLLAFWGYPKQYMGTVLFGSLIIFTLVMRQLRVGYHPCIWLSITASSALLAGMGIFQYFGFDIIQQPLVCKIIFGKDYHMMRFALTNYIEYGRVHGTIGNANYFAIYQLVAVPISLFVIKNCKQNKVKYFCVLAIAMSSISIFLSGSRFVSALLVLFFAYILLDKTKIRHKYAYKKQAVFVVSIFIIAAVYICMKITSHPDAFLSYRGYIWKNATKLISKSPLFGYGADTFVMYMPKMGDYLVVKPHHIALQLLFDFGVLGGTVFIFICIMAYKRLPKYLNYALLLLMLSGILHDLMITNSVLMFLLFSYEYDEIKFNKNNA